LSRCGTRQAETSEESVSTFLHTDTFFHSIHVRFVKDGNEAGLRGKHGVFQLIERYYVFFQGKIEYNDCDQSVVFAANTMRIACVDKKRASILRQIRVVFDLDLGRAVKNMNKFTFLMPVQYVGQMLILSKPYPRVVLKMSRLIACYHTITFHYVTGVMNTILPNVIKVA
jgi:hypothetical protein